MKRILVKFKEHPTSGQITSLELKGAVILHAYTHMNVVAMEVDEKAISSILDDPNVERIEEDGEVHALDEYSSAWGVSLIGCKAVHDKGIKGQAVRVAILDTGVDYNHPELSGIYKGGYDFVNNDSNPMDDHGHGTHCAGILAAALNGVGVVGVAPEVELYALKVLDVSGHGSWSSVIAALDWCITHGIQVTSNSYGGSGVSTLLFEAFNTAWAAGIISIAAAGNSGGNGSTDTVLQPARFDTVVAVAATDSNKIRATFSSTGPEVEVSAPGVDIDSCAPDGGYRVASGTSMACPHVAGLAALVKSAHPDWSNIVIRGQIRASANGGGHDWLYGFGFVDAPLACADLIPNPPPMPPIQPPVLAHEVETYPPNPLESNYATLLGELLTLGEMTSVDVMIYYGEETPPVNYLKPTPSKRMTAPGKYSYTVTGLKPSTNYICRTVGISNTGLWAYGARLIFTTKEAPPQPPPPPPPTTYMWAKSISFGVKGKNLEISVLVVDSAITPVVGVSVKVDVSIGTSLLKLSGKTNGRGIASMKINKPVHGTYIVSITSLVLTWYEWDKTKGVTSGSYVYASGQSCKVLGWLKSIFR